MIRRAKLGALAAITAFALGAPKAGADGQTAAPYILGVDDKIGIAVRDHPELSNVLRVMPDGQIALPGVGAVKAQGLRPSELAALIQKQLDRTLVDPQVIVTVETAMSLRVRVVGAVKAPGVLMYRTGMHLLDAVAMARGLSARPAWVRGHLVRGGVATPIDLWAATSRPDTSANPALEADDLVLLDEIDPTLRKASVMGCVVRPGAYEVGDHGVNVLRLLAMVGGPIRNAALAKCYVLRCERVIPVDLLSICTNGTSTEDVKRMSVLPGDVLVVPRLDDHFSVMGFVREPGQFALPASRQISALDALALAGGPTPDGDLRGATVMRLVAGRPVPIPTDLDRAYTMRDFTINPILQKDDVLVVPRKSHKLDYSMVATAMAVLSYLGLKGLK